jgi:3-oxoacyl-[acyl-carrier-protein] synthase-3
MTTYYSKITGWGMYVPERVLTNHDLAQMVDTSDEWIVTRTGIRTRHIAADGEATVSMALKASEKALAVAGITAADLDLILFASSTPDYLCPPASSLLQDRLGATKAGAMVLVAGCSGFVYGLVTASQFIQTGLYRHILVVGTEKLSWAVDWTDRNTCVLFGDGAGAVIVSRSQEPGGLISARLGSEGAEADALIVPAIGAIEPLTPDKIARNEHKIRMDGHRVFKFATRVMVDAVVDVVAAAGLTINDIDLIIPHQANERIIDLAVRRLGVDRSKVVVNIDRYGNTSAASVPLALCEALDQGRIQPGDKIVLVAFGAGLTYAACLWEWQGAETQEEPILVSNWPISETLRERLQQMRVAAWRAQTEARAKLSDATLAVMLPLYTFRKGVKKRLGK